MSLIKESYLAELLEKRWSPRGFSDEMIPEEDVKSIFDAGRQVASSFNEQPWSFIIASKEDPHYEKLYSCLDDFNQKWCKTAPYLCAAIGKTYFEKNEKDNRHCFHDVGAFLAVASLRTVEMGYFMHEMAGFFPEKVKEKFNVPDGHEPITMFVFGKPGSKEQLPDDIKEDEDPDSSRKDVSEFLFGEKWGKEHGILKS